MTLTHYSRLGLIVVAVITGAGAIAQAQQNLTSLDNLKRAQKLRRFHSQVWVRQPYTSGRDHQYEQ